MIEFVLLIASSLLITGLTYALVRQPGRLRQEVARTARLQRLTHLNQLVSASLDMEHVLREITKAAAMLTDTSFVRIWIADESNQTLELQAASDDYMAADYPVTKLSYGEGGAGWVARHRQRLHLPNIFADERVQLYSVEWWRTHSLSSLLAVPIIDQDSLLGVLSLHGRQPFNFGPDDQALLDGFVAQAAVAIRNARLFAESEARRRTAEVLGMTGRLLTETPDPDVVGQRIVDSVRGLMRTQACTLYRLQPDSGALVLLAISGSVGRGGNRQMVLPCGVGTVGLAVRERHPVVTPNLLSDPRIVLTPAARSRIAQAGYRAVLAIPLFIKDEVIGALSVADREGRTFDAEEIRLVQTFADQAALALENARLYAETTQRRREAEVVARLAKDINASLNLDTVLQRVVEGAKELCRSDQAKISLRGSESEALRIRYWTGISQTWDRDLLFDPGTGLGGLVLTSGRPARTDDYATDPRFSKDHRAGAVDNGIITSLVVPIKIGVQIEGLLYVDNRAPRPFTY